MKCVILAGGRGTRISEETETKPKPLVSVGGPPVLWHIMKLYAHHGVDEFVICLGYLGYLIKEYFANYYLHTSDVTIDLEHNRVHHHGSRTEPWKVTLVDTGDETMTGGRILRVREFLGDDDFCLTYGDGLADVDISAEIAFHKQHGGLATMAVVRPTARFGSAVLDGDRVTSFAEKAQASSGLINGGFFVVSPAALDHIDGDSTSWEQAPLERMARDGQLHAWRHEGFWQPMDTLREKRYLEQLWLSGEAPWRVWEPRS